MVISEYINMEGLQERFLVPLFPSKIALYSHVPTRFPYLFPFSWIWLQCFRPLICKVLFPCSLKIDSCFLVPFDIFSMFPCSPKPLGDPKYCFFFKKQQQLLWTGQRGKHDKCVAKTKFVVTYSYFSVVEILEFHFVILMGGGLPLRCESPGSFTDAASSKQGKIGKKIGKKIAELRRQL